MVKYSCLKCGRGFNQKCHFINHTEKRKKSCNELYSDTDVLNEDIIQQFQDVPICSKMFQNVPEGSIMFQKSIESNMDYDILLNNVEKKNMDTLDEVYNGDEFMCKYCFKIFSRNPNT
jgi:hypothetical protein